MRIKLIRLILFGIVLLLVMMTVGIGSSEKINVQQVGSFGSDREIGDIEVVGNYAYILQLGDLVVLSVTDPTNPVEVSRITPPTNTGFGSITSSEKYIYVAASDYSIGTTLMIYDINNPTTPKLVGQYTNPDSTEIIEVSNDYAYLLSYGKGCFILDVSNPASPQLVGQYILNDITNLDVSDQYLHLVAGHYLTGNSQTGSFMVLDISNPSEPKLVGQYTNSHIFNDVAVSGQYVYLANGANGLIVLDISNPTIPQLVGKLSVTGSDTEQVAISDKYIYALNSDSDVYSLEIVNIANPKVPTLVDQDYYTSYPEDPVEHYSAFDGCGIGAVSGNYIYMIPEYGGLAILKTEIHDDGPTEGSLVQVQGSPEVYLIENGFKRHFTSPEALEWNGYNFSDVIQVSSESLASIPDGADISITQAIIDKYHVLGGSSFFGATKGDGELIGDPDQDGNYCSYVNFEKGAIECFANGLNKGKAYAIVDQFYTKWASMGYGKSVLGYPIGDMSEERTSSKDTPYKYQPFTNGTQLGALEWNLKTNQVFEVHGAIFAKWAEIGFASSILGLPTGDEQDIPSSKYGTVGRYGTFENGHIHWNKATGVSFVTYGDLNKCYNKIQGTQSDLGFPIMSQVGTTDGYDYCEFEKGYIEWNANSREYEPNYGPTINQRIDIKLKAKPNFPQYLLDRDYVGATAIIWMGYSDYILKTDMAGQYDKYYCDGIKYYNNRNAYLWNAKQSLKNNDITNAEKCLLRADAMQKASEACFNAATYVFIGNTESAEIIAKGVRDEAEFIGNIACAYAGGSLSVLGHSVEYKNVVFGMFTFIDAYKDMKNDGIEEAAKQLAIRVATSYIVDEVKFNELGGKTLKQVAEEAPVNIDNNPILDHVFNEELTGNLMKATPEIHKRIMDAGVEAGIYLESEAVDRVLNALIEHQSRVSDMPYVIAIVASPVELRVHDSTGRVTGLVDGVVKNEIPNSIYESELETVFIYNATDTYSYETVGTANATYGLKILHYENMSDQEIILTDVPVTINAKHIYNVDWKNEAQVNKTVSIEEDLVSCQSISNIQCLIGSTWLNFTWTNPTYPYFNHTEIYLDGTFQTNTTAEYFNAAGLEPGKSYTLSTCTVDINGNVSNTWINLTATTHSNSKSGGGGGGSSSSSKSSGGGGGGGAGSAEDYANVAVKDVDTQYMRMNANVTYEFTKDGNPVQSVSFYSLKNSGEITSTIEVLNNRSKLVNSTPEGSIYKYVNIWVGKAGFATAANIKNAKVRFKVNSSWLQDMGLSASDVKLQRYNGTAWEVLPTTMESNTAGYVIFEAQTPGFSPFAITAEKVLASSTGDNMDVKSTETEDVGMNGTQPEKTPGFGFSTAILIIGVFAGGYVYLKGRE